MRYGLIKNGVCVSETEADNEKEAQRRAGVHGCIAVICPEYITIGDKYIDGEWYEIERAEPEVVPTQPTNAEVAQLISDLQADLLIAGVI